MAKAFIGVGSNIDREENIRSAVKALCKYFEAVVASKVYESSSVGFEGENFFNLVVGIETELSPRQLQDTLHEIEADYGRTRGGPRYVSRTLDLDLLLYDDMIVDEEDLQIPREDVSRFAFVLRPLSELAGDDCHPVSGISYAKMWQNFSDTEQKLWPVNFNLLDQAG